MKRSSPLFAVPESLERTTSVHLGRRQIPQIDGSRGAFIAVVVTLSVLIVVCCAAVFYLLRYHEPTEQDRTARRERYQRTRDQTLNSTSTFSGSGAGTLGDKVKQAWQSTTGRGRRGGRGWIRAGSDDEWASSPSRSDRLGRERERGLGLGGPGARGDPEVGGRLGTLPFAVSTVDDIGPGRGGDAAGIRVVESPLSDEASGFGVGGAGQFGYVYADPFGKTASEGALQRSQSPPLSSSSSSVGTPMSSPKGSVCVEEARGTRSPSRLVDDRRQRSAMSNGSVWTHAGSKFVEDI